MGSNAVCLAELQGNRLKLELETVSASNMNSLRARCWHITRILNSLLVAVDYTLSMPDQPAEFQNCVLYIVIF